MWCAFGIGYAAVRSENIQHHLDWRQVAEVRFASHEVRQANSAQLPC